MSSYYSDVPSSFAEEKQFEFLIKDDGHSLLDYFAETGKVPDFQAQLLSNYLEQYSSNTSKISSSANQSPQNLSCINEVDEQYLSSAYYDRKTKISTQKSKVLNQRNSNKNSKIIQNPRQTFIDKLQHRQMRLRQHQKLIIAMMFQLKLVKRLHDDINIMFQEAEQTYQKRNENLGNKKQQFKKTENNQQIIKIKKQLANQLTGHLNTLTQIRFYKKYCYNTHKIEKISGSFALDFKHFVYKVQGKDTLKTQNMTDYKGFSVGKKTKNFKKYLKKNEDPQDQLSFSLIFTNRTFDLQTFNPEQRNLIIKSLQQLQKCL